MDTLRAGIDRLERTFQGIGTAVRELHDETGCLDDAVQTAVGISTSIWSKVKQALTLHAVSASSNSKAGYLNARGRSRFGRYDIIV